MRSAGFVIVCLFGTTSACSTLLGADFDDLTGFDSGASAGAVGSAGDTSSSGGSAGDGASVGGALGSDSGGSSNGETGGSMNGGVGNTGATGGTDATGGDVGSGGTGATGGDVGSGGTGATGGGGGTGGMTIGDESVVLNEIKGQGAGADFIELYNRGPGSKNLAGYGVSDGGNTLTFPLGTTLAEGSYLLVLLQQTTSGGGFTCFTPSPCFHDTWAVSASGELVLLKNPQNQIIDSTEYPDEAGATGVKNGQTWGRFPNGTGNFRATATTPEAANTVP